MRALLQQVRGVQSRGPVPAGKPTTARPLSPRFPHHSLFRESESAAAMSSMEIEKKTLDESPFPAVHTLHYMLCRSYMVVCRSSKTIPHVHHTAIAISKQGRREALFIHIHALQGPRVDLNARRMQRKRRQQGWMQESNNGEEDSITTCMHTAGDGVQVCGHAAA